MNNKKNLALMVGVIIVFLILLEISFRISYPLYSNYNTEMWRYAKELKIINSNPEIAHEHKPNAKANLYGTEIIINSNGWRDKEFSLKTQKERVMILGDSITLGWGVDLEDSFPKILEEMLSDKEVINTGVGNYNTEMEVYSFFEKGKQYNPDIIILAYYINDAEITHPVQNKIKYFLLKSSYLYAFVSDKIINLRIKIRSKDQFLNFYSRLYEPSFEGRLKAEDSISVLSDYSKKNNIMFFIVIIPEMHEFKNYPFSEATDFVKDVGKKNNVTVIDLLPYFEKIEPESLWVSMEDAHPNRLGHRIIAEGIYEGIFNNG